MMSGVTNSLVVVGRGAGTVVGTLYQSGRDSVDQVIRNVIPFMAFISFVIGLILYTGIGNFVGMRWADWTAGGQVPDDVLDDLLEVLRRGLPPARPPQ